MKKNAVFNTQSGNEFSLKYHLIKDWVHYPGMVRVMYVTHHASCSRVADQPADDCCVHSGAPLRVLCLLKRCICTPSMSLTYYAACRHNVSRPPVQGMILEEVAAGHLMVQAKLSGA